MPVILYGWIIAHPDLYRKGKRAKLMPFTYKSHTDCVLSVRLMADCECTQNDPRQAALRAFIHVISGAQHRARRMKLTELHLLRIKN
jgi:hypothetical protein